VTPFETYFADVFPRLLDTVRGEPGLFSDGSAIERASWDRKAAYLLWRSKVNAATDSDVDAADHASGPGRPAPIQFAADLEDLLS